MAKQRPSTNNYTYKSMIAHLLIYTTLEKMWHEQKELNGERFWFYYAVLRFLKGPANQGKRDGHLMSLTGHLLIELFLEIITQAFIAGGLDKMTWLGESFSNRLFSSMMEATQHWLSQGLDSRLADDDFWKHLIKSGKCANDGSIYCISMPLSQKIARAMQQSELDQQT